MRQVLPQLSEYFGTRQAALIFDLAVDISKYLGQDSSLGGSRSEKETTELIPLSVSSYTFSQILSLFYYTFISSYHHGQGGSYLCCFDIHSVFEKINYLSFACTGFKRGVVVCKNRLQKLTNGKTISPLVIFCKVICRNALVCWVVIFRTTVIGAALVQKWKNTSCPICSSASGIHCYKERMGEPKRHNHIFHMP